MNSAARMACLLATISAWSTAALGDRAAYSNSIHLRAQAGDLVANHCHDFSLLPEDPSGDGWQASFSPRSPFGVKEAVSNLELYRRDGTTVARLTSPPLRYLTITPDARFIVVLSDVKFFNSTQLLVLDRSGAVVMRRKIQWQQFCFSQQAFDELRRKYGELIQKMAAVAEVTGEVVAWRQNGRVMFDPIGVVGAGADWEQMWKEVFPRLCPSPYSEDISETTTNLVRWYDSSGPRVQVLQRDGDHAASPG